MGSWTRRPARTPSTPTPSSPGSSGWGEGFLSPGGAAEVAAILEGTSLDGGSVLDIGSGLGGIDVLLVRDHGAARVLGIDVEAPLVERARALAEREGLADRLTFELVRPGPLPFADGRFDAVFSKDAIVHVADKAAFYAEIHRVLRPGGVFVGSDWLRGSEGPPTPAMEAWFEVLGLTFNMKTQAAVRRLLEQTGFADLRFRDRNAWYREVVRDEIARVSAENQAPLAERIGEAAARQRLASSTAKQRVVEEGELRPTHFHARKPL